MAAAGAQVAIERLLALVLALDESRPISAARLAERTRASLRTVYRDVERLRAAGVPVLSEPGRAGGLLIAPGYRLAPLGLTKAEVLALAMAVQLLRAQPALPFRAELESAARKIAGAARVERPELLRDVRSWLRIEPPAEDAFHPERDGERLDADRIGATVQTFVEALIGARRVVIDYHSPYARGGSTMQLAPAGVLADRGLWYLVAYPLGALQGAKHLRADRVRRCQIGERIDLGRVVHWRDEGPRPWLREAMQAWVREAPVVLEISAAQWRRLARDWYFGTGIVQPAVRGRVRFSWGEGDFDRVRELIAWLGQPARLIEPARWIPRLQRALVAHAALQRPPAR